VPKVTKAEIEYHEQLKRWEKQCERYGGEMGEMKESVSRIKGNWHGEKERERVILDEKQETMCLDLLKGVDRMMKTVSEDLAVEEEEKERDKVIVAAGR
jgi:hypothetical protein